MSAVLSPLIRLTTAVFDVVLAPFGHGPAGVDLVFWPLVGGLLAVVVYKYVSNQAAIARAKDQIAMRLYEVRLYREDVRLVLASTGRILWQNAIYLGHNLLPMVVMLGPMMLLLTQLVANYGFAPDEVGTTRVLEVDLAPGTAAGGVRLDVPAGVTVGDVVPAADGHAYFELTATAEGDHPLTLHAGQETLVKTWAVGGPPRKVNPLRTSTWEALLYPGEAPIPSDSAFTWVKLGAEARPLPWLPDGESGILLWFFALSLVAGFALSKPLGVTF